MGLGALATIGVQGPENLTVVVLDNGRWGETGMQPTHTSFGVDLAGIARASGFRNVGRITESEDVPGMREALHETPGPNLYVVAVIPEPLPMVLPPREGQRLKDRFRRALLGARADPR